MPKRTKYFKRLGIKEICKELQEHQIQELQDKESYSSYQEDLAFAKELNILRNDFYYQMVEAKEISLIDFLYHPLDVVSGDAYTARRIDENRTFYLLVDGMGKGLSASLTAMIMTSFVNHLIDRMLEFDSFSLDILISEAIDYIKPIFLDEEALAIDFILIDNYYNKLLYAKFAMPAFLLQNRDGSVIKIKSNNPPLSKWHNNFAIDEQSIKEIDKFLFYTDGVVENSVNTDKESYSQYIEEDFRDSFTREELKVKIFEKITDQEDDLTLVFINKLDLSNLLVTQKSFETSLSAIDEANEWYTQLWSSFSENVKDSYSANIVFTELYMNAYEHGNLAIDTTQKHTMIEEDTYYETLLEEEKSCEKKIHVHVYKLQSASSTYIITYIKDEGEGFDTQILSQIFRNSQTFNGRGVFVSRKNSMGIYYSHEGNSVLYLSKVQT